jgi:hypothetical protein
MRSGNVENSSNTKPNMATNIVLTDLGSFLALDVPLLLAKSRYHLRPNLAYPISPSQLVILILGIICGFLFRSHRDSSYIPMANVAQLSDRLTSKLSLHSRFGQMSTPSGQASTSSEVRLPASGSHQGSVRSPPPVPPRPIPNNTQPPAVNRNTRPPNSPSPTSQAGALYDPGNYPTPCKGMVIWYELNSSFPSRGT